MAYGIDYDTIHKEDPSIEDLTSFMEFVIKATSDQYSCKRGPRPSGAVLIADFVPIYGFVQPSVGTKSCMNHDECMMENGHCVRNLHAEVDALMTAARNGRPTANAVIFSINKPCYNCTIHLIRAGVRKIYYAYAVYDEDRTREALEAAGAQCIHVPVNID